MDMQVAPSVGAKERASSPCQPSKTSSIHIKVFLTTPDKGRFWRFTYPRLLLSILLSPFKGHMFQTTNNAIPSTWRNVTLPLMV